MGLFDPKINHLLHFLVSAFLAISFIIPLANHKGDHIVTGLSAIGLAIAGVQGVYHLGLSFAAFFGTYERELEAGKVARNLLTAGLVVVSAILMGQIAGMPDMTDLFSTGDKGTTRTFNFLGLTFALVMRFLDLFIDVLHDEKGEQLSIGDRFSKLMSVECAAKMPNEKAFAKLNGIFNARIVMVHLLLIGSGTFASIVAAGQTNIKLGELIKSDAGINMLAALCLIWFHAILYPMSLVINAIEPLQTCCIKANCGKPDDCSTLESWNRMPIVRSIVAAGVLCCLSYVLGNKLGGAEQVSNLLIALALYLGADAVGRNVV